MTETLIRTASALDVVHIVKLIKKGYGERMLAYQQVDDSLAVEFAMRLIHGFTLVAERGGRIVGVHANLVRPEEWSQTRYVDNAFFYVLPSERKHGTAERLIELVERNADGAGLFVRQGTFGGERDGALQRLLEARGYQYIGSYFAREPREQSHDPEADDDSESAES